MSRELHSEPSADFQPIQSPKIPVPSTRSVAGVRTLNPGLPPMASPSSANIALGARTCTGSGAISTVKYRVAHPAPHRLPFPTDRHFIRSRPRFPPNHAVGGLVSRICSLSSGLPSSARKTQTSTPQCGPCGIRELGTCDDPLPISMRILSKLPKRSLQDPPWCHWTSHLVIRNASIARFIVY
jgi:hypothetical protein